MDDYFLTFTTLQTIVVEIEAILNDRPLTHVSSNTHDNEPLTLPRLLYRKRITTLPHIRIEEDEIIYADHRIEMLQSRDIQNA